MRYRQKPEKVTTNTAETKVHGSLENALPSKQLVADTISGVITWTLLSSLTSNLFFMALFDMRFSGWEIMFFSTLSPSLLVYPFIKEMSFKYFWLFRLLGLIGLLAFYIKSTTYIIFVICLGLFFDMIGIYSVCIQADDQRRNSIVYGQMLGVVIICCMRMMWLSMSPIWLNQTVNTIFIILGLIAVVIYASEKMEPQKVQRSAANLPWGYCAFVLGGLLFQIHFLLSGHGVIPRWVGVNPFPFGGVSILAMMVGILFSYCSFVDSVFWWLGTTFLGTVLFYTSQNEFPWGLEFFGGVLLIIGTVSTWPVIITTVVSSPKVGKLFLAGIFLYIFEQIWSLYTVSYKFLPLPDILRERSISLGYLVAIQLALGSVRQFTSLIMSRKKVLDLPPKSVILILLLTTVLLFTPSLIYRGIKDSPKPHSESQDAIRTLVWAIHFGYDNFGGWSGEKLVDMIKSTKANIIGLVETDCLRPIMDNRDPTEWLASELNFYQDYGPTTAKNTWGCSLLSAFPIVRSKQIVLPSPQGEQACMIDADILVNGTLVRVVTHHFGNTEDEIDLELQTQTLISVLNEKDRPDIVMVFGYFTMFPFSERYIRIINEGNIVDSMNSMNRYCLYQMSRNIHQNRFWREEPGDTSDTEAQIAEYTFLKEKIVEKDPTPEYCRGFGNNTHNCQQARVCGWCQHDDGNCYEPDMKLGCELVRDAVWVPPRVFKGKIREMDKYDALTEYLAVHWEQQKKHINPVFELGKNKFIWHIKTMKDINWWDLSHCSGGFPWNGEYWRMIRHVDILDFNITDPAEAKFGLELEKISIPKNEENYEISEFGIKFFIRHPSGSPELGFQLETGRFEPSLNSSRGIKEWITHEEFYKFTANEGKEVDIIVELGHFDKTITRIENFAL